MPKSIFIGVEGKARKVKEGFIGVEGKARKVKEGFVGVNGIARPFFSSEQKLIYYGAGTPLSVGRIRLIGVDFNQQALFIGGEWKENGFSTRIDSFDNNLILTTNFLDTGDYMGKGIKFNDCVVYGYYLEHKFVKINKDLTFSLLPNLDVEFGRQPKTMTSFINKVFSCGDIGNNCSIQAFDSNLVKDTVKINLGNVNMSATFALDNHLIICHSIGNNGIYQRASCFDKNLTKTVITFLAYDGCDCTVNNNLGIVGPRNKGSGINILNDNLVDSSIRTGTMHAPNVTNCNGTVLIGGGNYNASSSDTQVLSLDLNLVKTEFPRIDYSGIYSAAASNNNYAIIGGGKGRKYYGDQTYAYKSV